MLEGVALGFALAIASPWLYRLAKGATGWALGLALAGLAVQFFRQIGEIQAHGPITSSWPWVPSLGIALSFHLDGLSLLFALLITGIGALVAIYAGGYLAGHPQIGRFYAWLMAFMASMLGLVLADNVLTLFVFWELTSLTSYLLIGFNHDQPSARAAALQALLVTGGGGLALLAGLLLLGQAGGSYELSVLAERGEAIRGHALYWPILLLVLAGAFTKSAQFPFHFWLPNAMEAPTPVSAYLHSSTMVKAGVYLLARLAPTLGGTAGWTVLLCAFGTVTMLAGGWLALQHRDLKRILAYTTISVLGAVTLLLGAGPTAAQAAMVLLLAHALYKASLFLVAGAVDHEAGTRDIGRLGGLGRVMPVTAAAAVLAAMSNAGLPPSLGYIAKEAFYEATWTGRVAAGTLTAAAVLANVMLVAASGLVGLRPFIGPRPPLPKTPHEAPISLWLGPVVLAGAGLVLGLLPRAAEPLVAPAIVSVTRAPEKVHLALWHGFNAVLAFSAITLAAGLLLYLRHEALSRRLGEAGTLARWGPDRCYEMALRGLNRIAALQTRWLQSGFLRFYLMIVILVMVGLAGYTLLVNSQWIGAPAWTRIGLHEAMAVGVILAAALTATLTSSRLAAVAALGGVGYGVMIIFVLYGAPDLAMTQFAIETLTVILFVLVLYRLPRFNRLSGAPAKLRDALVALTAGAFMTVLVLATTALPAQSRLTPFLVEKSLPEGKGRNVVNVILVDFRALDTLGEITVLAVAAIGVYALIKLRIDERASRTQPGAPEEQMVHDHAGAGSTGGAA